MQQRPKVILQQSYEQSDIRHQVLVGMMIIINVCITQMSGMEGMGDIAQNRQSRNAMQVLYKNQLDSLMQQKEELRQQEKQRLLEEKTRYNANLEFGQQAQKMKDLSYRNYYAMLMNNQQVNQEAYVNPYAEREDMKDSHVNSGLESEKKKYDLFQLQLKKKEAQRKYAYKNQLLAQINDRRNRQLNQKYQRHIPYNSRVQHSSGVAFPQVHNTLTNPMPFNIQNPYLLKEMASLNTPQRAQKQSQSYLAAKGNNII